MFHATLLMLSTCFMHTLCHIRAFSGTNLLTRCRSASCCFLLFLVSEILVRKYSRNWTKSKPRGLFPHEASRSPKERRRGATEGPHHRAARPRGGPRGPVVWPPRPASDALLRTIYRPRPKNARGEVEVARNPPERRHIAKLRLGSQKSPFWHSAGTGNWRRSSPPSPPTPLHQPAMFPPSMCE